MAKKSISQQVRPKFQTRKGTKPNIAKGRLLNVSNGVEVKRVHETEARKLVATGLWNFVPKRGQNA